MDFWRTVMVLFRRWYVTLPAFLLAIGGALLGYSTVPVRYVSTAALVLTTPPTGGTLAAEPDQRFGITNPLLNFDHGLSMSASILIQALGTPEVNAELGVTPGGETSYQVTNGSTNPELITSGPFVFIAGESATAEAARDIVRKVVDRTKLELANRQKELAAPESTFIRVSEVVPPTTAEAQGGSRMRAAAAALGLGLIACLASGYATESYVTRRDRRRVKRAPVSEETRDPALTP